VPVIQDPTGFIRSKRMEKQIVGKVLEELIFKVIQSYTKVTVGMDMQVRFSSHKIIRGQQAEEPKQVITM